MMTTALLQGALVKYSGINICSCFVVLSDVFLLMLFLYTKGGRESQPSASTTPLLDID